jgi:hypothetical protein
VRGANGIPFQMLGMVHPRLRTAALPAELLNKRGKSVEVRVGGAIEPAQIDALPDDESAIRYLRLRTDLLARRDMPARRQIVPDGGAPPITSPTSSAGLAREIEGLPPACLLDAAREMAVFIAEPPAIWIASTRNTSTCLSGTAKNARSSAPTA